MKKLMILTGSILLIVGLIVYNIFFTAGNHVTTISKNIDLKKENSQLIEEKTNLEKKVSKLESENAKLVKLSDSLNAQIGNILPKAITSIELEIETTYQWATPEYVYEELTTKLDRKPTKQEFNETLKELNQKKLLYHPGHPDPSSKGKQIQLNEIEKIVSNF